ncbi:hypothetical protein [Aquipuribacter hungaricus]|uniref:DUF5872 domain-containing protein n=1 Tax=Aquipuribacter hungaricus TaxID=545624 RepID=A0ABV7WJ18_9MICO
MARTPEQKYTDPDLRERLKAEVVAGDKGGRPGQWSARKAQLLAHEYEKAGGGYTGGKDETQQHLSEWTDQDWQTADGDDRARHGEETSRYLPAAAWDELSPAEKKATEAAKREGSRRGEQHVANTPAAAEAGKAARAEEPLRGYDDLTVPQVLDRLDGMDEDALRALEAYEQHHKDRATLLRRVRARLG